MLRLELGTYGLKRRRLCWLLLILLADTVGGFIRFDWNCSGLLILGDVVDFCGVCSAADALEAVGDLIDTFGLGRPDFRLVLDSLEIDFRMSELLADCFFWLNDETDVEELSDEKDDDSCSIFCLDGNLFVASSCFVVRPTDLFFDWFSLLKETETAGALRNERCGEGSFRL